MKTLLVLGRQKNIALSELESLYGAKNFNRISDNVVGCELDQEDIDFQKLGGSVKLASFLKEYNFTDWNQLEKYLTNDIANILNFPIEGKMQFGISSYGFDINLGKLRNLSLNLKNTIKKSGQSIRMIPNQDLQLNSAQVIHNKLLGEKGTELLLIKSRFTIIIAKTVQEQNIDSYSMRDYNRPFRDSRVGMLPPKLAQILINLANPQDNDIVLDPFCGTGVILQEACIDRLRAYGTDIDQRMIDYSDGNLKWLEKAYRIEEPVILELGDATNHEWQSFDCVACETYLGQAYSSYPDKATLNKNIQNCDTIISKFLINIHDQLPVGKNMALALPAWDDRINKKFISLPLIDHLEDLGYNRLRFSIIQDEKLFYHRPGQIVARQLIVITRN
ncbi:MAG: DNA methyltransferase [bacterium]